MLEELFHAAVIIVPVIALAVALRDRYDCGHPGCEIRGNSWHSHRDAP